VEVAVIGLLPLARLVFVFGVSGGKMFDSEGDRVELSGLVFSK
jgi:hypothetical protein